MARVWVSTHALRRYVERVCGFVLDLKDDRLAVAAMGLLGFDLPRIEREILDAVGEAPAIGAASLTKGGLRFVFSEGRVVTVIGAYEEHVWGERKLSRAERARQEVVPLIF